VHHNALVIASKRGDNDGRGRKESTRVMTVRPIID